MPDEANWKRYNCDIGKDVWDRLPVEKLSVVHTTGCFDSFVPETIDWHALENIHEELNLLVLAFKFVQESGGEMYSRRQFPSQL